METRFKIQYKTTVKAPLEKVWEALTNPAIVKEYFFGSELVTSWQVGTPIVFQGEWEGQSYQDKGEVLEYEPNKRLAFSYLSNWSGKEDLPENYLWVCYEVSPHGTDTELVIHQSNYDQERADHSAENWDSVVSGMKKIVES
ncbi:SRPBCC domain-containing protein [Neolewinella lacunae]|uniref:SRPBCC domain-containing protein n=1 Tax=Neolewinella lacunae TaxID=1517758 RepID=A0A923PKE0_9BACT|nr:SRPBCC domain-containing protein [Neolewinella lacunae]MBC6993316.1 SRPBCC domain-containing protein [Neolewinella lacunae]MDN3636843.1 SRPBCC domain-containing protein [Neolewinella lacunae]